MAISQEEFDALTRRVLALEKLVGISPATPVIPCGRGFQYSDLFEAFWSAYPKKTAKGEAYRAFQRIKGRPEIDVLVAAIKRQMAGHDWKRDNGQYIPHPSTWLNQRRWEDEDQAPVPVNGKTSDWSKYKEELNNRRQ